MKSDEFLAETTMFKSRADWHQRMQEIGAGEFINDTEFDDIHKTDLIYAVGTDNMLKGTWSNNTNSGKEYKGAKGLGMKFYKQRRKFRKSDI